MNFTNKLIQELPPEAIKKLTRAEKICAGLLILLNHGNENGEEVDTCAHHDKFLAGTETPPPHEDHRLLEKLGWSESSEGGYEIFT